MNFMIHENQAITSVEPYQLEHIANYQMLIQKSHLEQYYFVGVNPELEIALFARDVLIRFEKNI